MADALSILASAYRNPVAYTPGTYKPVDAKLWSGTWEGEQRNGDKFKFSIQNITGYRATVRFEIGNSFHNETVLIKDNAFKISASKFTLTKAGVAEVKTVYNKADGSQTVLTATASKTT